MSQDLRVPRLLSDHMVIQHGKPVHLWGTDAPGRVVRARLSRTDDGGGDASCAEATADVSGAWSLFLPAMAPGTETYTVMLTDDGGGCVEFRDVLIGEVWFASGQSNMELTMERVRDRYPDVIRDCSNPYIRTFKIAEHTDYHGALSEPLTGEWRLAAPESILDFSATGYFFARALYAETGIPVGFLHASLGGSRISGWMDKEMLAAPTMSAPEGYPALLAEAARYADDGFLAAQIARNEENAASWDRELARREASDAARTAGTLTIPCFFKDISELSGFIGKISLKRSFHLTEEMLRAARDGRIRLFLGTLVDRDEVLLNGSVVGATGYQYPPRKYEVPPEFLRAGDNEIEIRLVVESGCGRLTPQKRYAIFCEKEHGKTSYDTGGFPVDGAGARTARDANLLWDIDLSGVWRYRVLAAMDAPLPETDFVNWHPTGLYNGMAAPCTLYPIDGILWYQGESNTHLPEDYEDLQRRLMRGLRRAWHRRSEPGELSPQDAARGESIPFLYVQLPNFAVDLDETGLAQWAALREKQARCLTEPLSGMIETAGLGCDNDLHPHEKREIGERLAALALQMKPELLCQHTE